MNAPISRERQIELMATAKDRHSKRIADWHSDPIIRGVLLAPTKDLLAPTKEQATKSDYKAVRRKSA